MLDKRQKAGMESILHIGLGKCASTELQNIWLRADNYRYHQLDNLVDIVTSSLVANPSNLQKAVDIIKEKTSLHSIALDDNVDVNVFSSEGITFSFLSNAEFSHLIPMKQKILAYIIKNTSKKALLLIRNPKNWIESAYAQYVKEGGYLPINEYLHDAKNIIIHNLNISYIIKIFEECDIQVKVMPIELIKVSETYFWEQYEKELGVDRPNGSNFKHKNATNFVTLPTHIRLNQVLAKLENLVSESNQRQDEHSEILKALGFSRRWATRTALSDLSLEQLSNLNDLLGYDANDTPQTLNVDQNLLDLINVNFLRPLEDVRRFPYKEILQSYEESLHSLRC